MTTVSDDPVLNQVLLSPSCRIGTDYDAWVWDIGGTGLEAALKIARDDESGQIIDMVKAADLRGLGGSGFPAWIKWTAVAKHGGEKYLICNGNEDEPGTFKDRVLMEECPYQLIEGATITAIACGINQVVFYINPHLTGAIDTMRRAIMHWENSEWPERIRRQAGLHIQYRVHQSSGHYIGGEETAAIESVEGKFPFPRAKPPYPADHGVHGRPTLINNVETISNVPHLLRNGVEWFRKQGLGEATGTKIYSCSGDILRPGIYELPMGTPLKDLIFKYGQGMLVGKELKAIFTGGPSNTILTPKDIDVPMDFESVAARRSALGTGAMIAVSQGTGIVKKVAEYVSFFASSSCGQCPSCKTGTYYMAQLLNRIGAGMGTDADINALENLCRTLPGSGRCALVNGAVKVLESSMYHFGDEYQQSLRKVAA